MDITEKQSEMYGSLTKCESFKSEWQVKQWRHLKILDVYEEETKGYEKLTAVKIMTEMWQMMGRRNCPRNWT